MLQLELKSQLEFLKAREPPWVVAIQSQNCENPRNSGTQGLYRNIFQRNIGGVQIGRAVAMRGEKKRKEKKWKEKIKKLEDPGSPVKCTVWGVCSANAQADTDPWDQSKHDSSKKRQP